MTDPNLTAMCILADRSTSMLKIKQPAEDAINEFIDGQRHQPGRCLIHLTEFDTDVQTLWNLQDIEQVGRYELNPTGSTALLDALGVTITSFGQELAAMPEHERPDRVLFITQTDGEENSSRVWKKESVFELISHQREVYKWDFVFLGANQDAIDTARQFGIPADSALTYATTASGVHSSSKAMGEYATSYRTTGRASFTAEDRKKAVDE